MGRVTELEPEAYTQICCNVCLYHHEQYDGKGYPYGLQADAIPLEAQLVGLADLYDILLHAPSKRESYSASKVYHMLMQGQCGELSPTMKECLTSARNDLESYSLPEEIT